MGVRVRRQTKDKPRVGSFSPTFLVEEHGVVVGRNGVKVVVTGPVPTGEPVPCGVKRG